MPLTMNREVFITCAVTGSGATQDKSPHVPRSPEQIAAAAIEAAAIAAGLEFVVQPLTHQTMVPEVIGQNRALGADTDDVVLAYCASGTRSTIAWALGQKFVNLNACRAMHFKFRQPIAFQHMHACRKERDIQSRITCGDCQRL